MASKLRPLRLVLWSMVVVVAGAAVAAGVWNGVGPDRGVSEKQDLESAIVARFSLVDHTGKAVTEADYQGKWLLVFFGYTNCPDVCPTTLNEIAGAMDLLEDKAARIQPLFITIDPERDTQQFMAQYVKAFDRRIVGLTGTPDQIKSTSESFRVFYEKATEGGASEGETSEGETPDGYFMNHTASVYVINPEGKFVIPFSYGTASDAMAEKLRKLI